MLKKDNTIWTGHQLLTLLTLMLLLVWGTAHAATETEALDVVLVMDSSGSMKKTDPQELRKPAAKLLLSLLGKEDRASVVSFSDQGYPIAYLTPLEGQKNQDALFAAVEKISSKGAYTNIAGAIKTAHRVLNKSKQADRRQIIILMSDGQMDLGEYDKDKQATRELVKAVLPELKNSGIEVHTIAFTDSSDKPLLQSIANLTEGQFNIAKTDRDLHGVFTAIFEENKSPDILPFEGEKFSIDGNVKEVTIIATKDTPTTHVTLTTPSNVKMDAMQNPESVKWLVSEQFDLITIQAPEIGQWMLNPPSQKNRAYIITDLKLRLELQPEHPVPGDQLNIKVWLEEEGHLLQKQPVLSSLQVDLIQDLPDGSYQKMAMYSDREGTKLTGYYGAEVLLRDGGRYRVEINATTGTFERTKSKIIDVITPMDPNEVVDALESDKPEELIHLPGVEAAVQSTEPVAKKAPEPKPAKANKPEPPAKPAPAPKVPEPKDEEGGAMFAIIAFILFNLLLIGGGVGFFFWMKKRKGAGRDDDSDDSATEKEVIEESGKKKPEPIEDEPILDEKKSSKKESSKKNDEGKGNDGEMLFEEMSSDDS